MPNRFADDRRLGSWLKDRRARLDPAAFGLPPGRRRTPGLRREEVAQRANISATWYTWLEQGRGGAPSADVLDRIARALMLTDAEREHLFLIGLGRPPEARYSAAGGVTPRLQRVLDALDPTPAMIRTATWDVVAWNRAATVFLHDYSAVPAAERNVLRFLFLDPKMRQVYDNWQGVARAVVSLFRIEAARAGAAQAVAPLVEELSRRSPEFAALWAENEIIGHREMVKHIRHPILGQVAFEYSTFQVDGRSDLSLLVYTLLDEGDAARIAELAAGKP